MSRTTRSGLAAAAAVEFTAHVLSGLPPAQRYTGAMLKRALEVLQAEAAAGPVPDVPGFGPAEALARALRARTPLPEADVRRALRIHVEQKLGITNPRFLRDTRAAGEGQI